MNQISAKPSLETIHEEITQLPMLPGILFQLMKFDPEDTEFYDHMLLLAKSDPPLAAFIIGYSNSALSSPNQKIDTLQKALTRVGSRTIIELLTALSVSKVFVPQKDEHKAIWRHSVEVASFSAFLARLSPEEHLEPDSAYLSGLLHDIGRFVLFQIAPDALNETDAKGWSTPDELISAEVETVGFTHAKVGYLACVKLEIPKLISNIVRYHHNIGISYHPKAPKTLQDHCLVVQIADAISVMLAKNPDWKNWSEENLKENLLSFCINPKWDIQSMPINSIIPALPMLVENAERTCESIGV
ncbi:HDOD domain-containing protein [uncultured Neptuniibacter sp.]|uniref:HDOD domain-containing protein n=1 Tax=uncultured Neptuniibacter sp. TaxID=502143 RepID=UPI0026143899|nr:HDOD domain-containing protein [uncultured Neptuniibacter sp.]